MRNSIYQKLFNIFLILCLSINLCKAANNEKFRLVTNTSELKDGDRIIIVHEEDGYAFTLNQTRTSSTVRATEINVENNIATINDETSIIELKKAGSYFYLYVPSFNGYISNQNTTSSKDLSISTNNDNTTKAQITVFDDYTSIYFKGSSSQKDRYLYYNSLSQINEGPEQKSFSLYRKIDMSKTDRRVMIFKELAIADKDIAMKESDDNSQTISDNTDQAVNVQLTRTLVANKWNTFCVPFDIDINNGYINGVKSTVMKYESDEGCIMQFTNADKIEAGQAYIVKPIENIENPTFYNVSITDKEPATEGNKYKIRGIYSKHTFNSEEAATALILNSEAEFKRPKANTTTKGFRAYFITPAKEESMPALLMRDESTGISEIIRSAPEEWQPTKVYNINGTFIGTETENLPKGIYIMNNKKFVVK